MVVALGATDGEPEPDGADGVHAVDDILVEILVGIGAALVVGHVVPHEAGRDPLRLRGRGHEIAGQLLDGEGVEGLVVVEGIDDPVAPEPHETHAVEMVAAGVGIAGEI